MTQILPSPERTLLEQLPEHARSALKSLITSEARIDLLLACYFFPSRRIWIREFGRLSSSLFVTAVRRELANLAGPNGYISEQAGDFRSFYTLSSSPQAEYLKAFLSSLLGGCTISEQSE